MAASNILIVDNLSTMENIFFVIYLLVIYLHGLWIVSFFIGYIYASHSQTNQKIKNIWKVIVTFFIYQVALYSILVYFGEPERTGWPHLAEVAAGLKTMTGAEFLFVFIVGIWLSIVLKKKQHSEEDPYMGYNLPSS